jgi:phage protein U
MDFNARFNPTSPYFIDLSVVMLQLGEFQFSVGTAAYQSLERKTQYPWQSQDRINQHKAWQYGAKPDESLQLEGIIYPQYKGGDKQVDALRQQAAQGKPLMMVDALGKVHGEWIIVSLNEKQTQFNTLAAPLKQSFQLELKRYVE